MRSLKNKLFLMSPSVWGSNSSGVSVVSVPAAVEFQSLLTHAPPDLLQRLHEVTETDVPDLQRQRDDVSTSSRSGALSRIFTATKPQTITVLLHFLCLKPNVCVAAQRILKAENALDE